MLHHVTVVPACPLSLHLRAGPFMSAVLPAGLAEEPIPVPEECADEEPKCPEWAKVRHFSVCSTDQARGPSGNLRFLRICRRCNGIKSEPLFVFAAGRRVRALHGGSVYC